MKEPNRYTTHIAVKRLEYIAAGGSDDANVKNADLDSLDSTVSRSWEVERYARYTTSKSYPEQQRVPNARSAPRAAPGAPYSIICSTASMGMT